MFFFFFEQRYLKQLETARGERFYFPLTSVFCLSFSNDRRIGLVPFAGDAVTLMMAMNLIHTAQKADIPKELTQRMLVNVAIDFGVCGETPLPPFFLFCFHSLADLMTIWSSLFSSFTFLFSSAVLFPSWEILSTFCTRATIGTQSCLRLSCTSVQLESKRPQRPKPLQDAMSRHLFQWQTPTRTAIPPST